MLNFIYILPSDLAVFLPNITTFPKCVWRVLILTLNHRLNLRYDTIKHQIHWELSNSRWFPLMRQIYKPQISDRFYSFCDELFLFIKLIIFYCAILIQNSSLFPVLKVDLPFFDPICYYLEPIHTNWTILSQTLFHFALSLYWLWKYCKFPVS